jgi:hypothetical protein
MDDELATSRRQLIARGAALVAIISVWMMVRFRRRAHPSIPFVPRLEREIFNDKETLTTSTIPMTPYVWTN